MYSNFQYQTRLSTVTGAKSSEDHSRRSSRAAFAVDSQKKAENYLIAT